MLKLKFVVFSGEFVSLSVIIGLCLARNNSQ
jgi:hypothetical protein